MERLSYYSPPPQVVNKRYGKKSIFSQHRDKNAIFLACPYVGREVKEFLSILMIGTFSTNNSYTVVISS